MDDGVRPFTISAVSTSATFTRSFGSSIIYIRISDDRMDRSAFYDIATFGFEYWASAGPRGMPCHHTANRVILNTTSIVRLCIHYHFSLTSLPSLFRSISPAFQHGDICLWAQHQHHTRLCMARSCRRCYGDKVRVHHKYYPTML